MQNKVMIKTNGMTSFIILILIHSLILLPFHLNLTIIKQTARAKTNEYSQYR